VSRQIREETLQVLLYEMVVSVTERSERDLTKRFDETEIGWTVIERQLVAWRELFHAGKELRVYLSFNYLETGQQPATRSRKEDKRSFTSADADMDDWWRCYEVNVKGSMNVI
jgi:hypothetical protein